MAAARLGAAISHDFCAISLSDLLTPWPVIEQRIRAAAVGDFVVAFYNPRSRERHWQLGRAFELLREQRPPDTPVAFARNLARADEQITVTTLAEADPAHADMFTLVLIGSSQSYQLGAHMATPRGYAAKWGDESGLQPDVQDDTTQQRSAPPTLRASYPITLTNMKGALAVVVGGGLVGERKTRGLLAVGAIVRLISPAAQPQLRAWTDEGLVEWLQRDYQPGDLADARLVFAATNERQVNAQVAAEAAERAILCNVADAPGEGTFHLPAVHHYDDLFIAVSSNGASPITSRAVRDWLAKQLAQAGYGQINADS
jgi:cobalt-precorrin 5A hydrolase/precorrin-3B C17-methyltransferase